MRADDAPVSILPVHRLRRSEGNALFACTARTTKSPHGFTACQRLATARMHWRKPGGQRSCVLPLSTSSPIRTLSLAKQHGLRGITAGFPETSVRTKPVRRSAATHQGYCIQPHPLITRRCRSAQWGCINPPRMSSCTSRATSEVALTMRCQFTLSEGMEPRDCIDGS